MIHTFHERRGVNHVTYFNSCVTFSGFSRLNFAVNPYPLQNFKGRNMSSVMNVKPKEAKINLVGSGIASLASAIYLEKDAGVPGKNIDIISR
jgi:hypothetical protein